MKRFELAGRALLDLEEIWVFVAQDSPDAADRLVEEFYSEFRRIAQMPGIGHRRNDLTTLDVLFRSLYSYLIVYQDSQPVTVVRVIHGKRDVNRVLEIP